MVVYTGIALVGDQRAAGRRRPDAARQPLPRGRAGPRHRRGVRARTWLRDGLKYLIAAPAAVTLVAAANSAMLGLSRLAYSLATNRQIPSARRPAAPDALDAGHGDRHRGRPRRRADAARRTSTCCSASTPSARCSRLTIAHAVDHQPALQRARPPAPVRDPASVRIGRGGVRCRCRRCVGAAARARWPGSASSSTTTMRAGSDSAGWPSGSRSTSIYRRTTGKLAAAQASPSRARRCAAEQERSEYGSILVPITGTPLDDDIMQTAGRLAAEEDLDERRRARGRDDRGALGLRDPDGAADRRAPARRRARRARARRWRGPRRWARNTRASQWRRRRSARGAPARRSSTRRGGAGSSAIVLAAEEPSKIRGGTRLGGRRAIRELRRRRDQVRRR